MASAPDAGDIPALVQRLRSSSKVAQLQAAKALARLARGEMTKAIAAAPGCLPASLRLFRAGGSMAARQPAAELISRVIAATGGQDTRRAFVMESGVHVPFLASLLRGSRSNMVLLAATILLGLVVEASPERGAAAATALAAGVVPPLVRMLGANEAALQAPAAACLSDLVCISTAACSEVVAAGGTPLLTRLLASSQPIAKNAAAGALRDLATAPERRDAIVAAGAVPGLAALLGSTEKETAQSAAAAALRNLALGCREEALQAFIAAGPIPALFELVHSGTSLKARQLAAAALASVAAAGHEGAAAIAAAGGVAALQEALEGEAATDLLKEAASLALDSLRLSMRESG